MTRSVLVMMGTFNGIRFLDGQVTSILRQSPPVIDLLVSDDGSTDGTFDYLEKLKKDWGKGNVDIIRGPGRGFRANFRHLIGSAPGGYDAYAFSDQDDIWHDDKLELALSRLGTVNSGVPALFCGRTRIVDEQGGNAGLSPLFSRPPSFQNAIVQSIAGGNTMVMNAVALEKLREASARTTFVTHDWWAYQLITGIGGVVIYHEQPTVDYRQHGNNLIGANSSWRARMIRLILMAGGRFSRWNGTNIDALRKCSELLTPQARDTTERFAQLRECKSPVKRLFLLRESGIHRQTSVDQFSLYVAAFFGKI